VLARDVSRLSDLLQPLSVKAVEVERAKPRAKTRATPATKLRAKVGKSARAVKRTKAAA
jgi:hypothetical protein